MHQATNWYWIITGTLSEEDKELNSYHVLNKTLMWCSVRRQNAPGPQGPLPADSFENAAQQIRENTLHLNPATARIISQIYAVKVILCTSFVPFTKYSNGFLHLMLLFICTSCSWYVTICISLSKKGVWKVEWNKSNLHRDGRRSL